jgi:hypothetical protein
MQDEARHRRRVGIGCRARRLFEEQQNLTGAGLHGAAAVSEAADDVKAEDILVELDGTGDVFYVERGLEDSLGVWAHVLISMVLVV